MPSMLSRLTFGRNIPDGDNVAETDWQDFVSGTIAGMFPDGFTVIHAEGGWRDASTGLTIREPSVVLEVAHDDTDEARTAIRTVAALYKALFRQDAVMVTTVRAAIEFV